MISKIYTNTLNNSIIYNVERPGLSTNPAIALSSSGSRRGGCWYPPLLLTIVILFFFFCLLFLLFLLLSSTVNLDSKFLLDEDDWWRLLLVLLILLLLLGRSSSKSALSRIHFVDWCLFVLKYLESPRPKITIWYRVDINIWIRTANCVAQCCGLINPNPVVVIVTQEKYVNFTITEPKLGGVFLLK